MAQQQGFRIGLDFDDVLIASGDHVTKLYNSVYGTNLTRDNWYDDEEAVEPWGVDSFTEVVKRVIEIESLDEFLDAEPLKDSQEVLRLLKDAGHELVVVTGRPESLRSNTMALLNKYYGGIISPDALYFTDYYQHTGERLDKGDIAKKLELTHFIDDMVVHVNTVMAKGVKGILFSDNYHWNQSGLDKAATRANSWKEIGVYFDDEQRAK